MNRRSFFRRTICAIAAATVAPFIPVSPSATPLGLRYIETFDFATHSVCRFDVIYGFSTVRSNFACRITEEQMADQHGN